MTTPEQQVGAIQQIDPNEQGQTNLRLRTDLIEIVSKMGGMLTADMVDRIEHQIASNEVNSKRELSVAVKDEVNGYVGVMSGAERKKAFALASEALEETGYPVEGQDLDFRGDEQLSTKLMRGPVRWLANFVSGGTYRGMDQTEQVAAEKKQKMAFIRQLLADKEVSLKEYDDLVATGFLDDDRSIADVVDMLSDDFGVNDETITSTLKDTTTAVFRRENIERRDDEQRKIDDDAVAGLMDDDEKLENRRAFESLEETYPGKYVWNGEKGMIFEAGTGALVDRTGTMVEYGAEGYNDEDLFWEEATTVQPPWVEQNIDEDTYYQLIDVVNNPDRFHAGGVERFASGRQFLGGYESDYAVAQDAGLQEAQRQDRTQAATDPMYGNVLDTVQAQANRRPWYDQMDNWAMYAGKSPESVAEDQRWLMEMGAITADDITEGTWGKTEADAMQKMMFIANGRAERIEDIDGDFWQDYWDDEAGSGSQRAKFSAPSYRRLDPARIQLTIEDTVRRSLGRDASSDELADLGVYMSDQHRQSFVADVEAMEAEYNAQASAIDDQKRTAAGEVPDVDYEARFMQKFNETNATELDRYERTQNVSERQQLIGGALNNFMNQLGGGIGGGN